MKSYQNVCKIFWPLGHIFVCTKMGEGWDWAIFSTPLDVPLGQKPICLGGGGGAYISGIISRRDIVLKKPNTKTATCMYQKYIYSCKCKVLSYLLSCLRSFTVI